MISPARQAALYIIERSRRDGAWSAAVIDSAAGRFELSSRDAAFAARAARGVLENIALCDYYISCCCQTPMNRLEPRVLDIMRLAAYQLAFMDRVPESAAVNDAVEQCREKNKRACSLVNAVLRRLAVARRQLPEIPDKGTARHLATRYSHPLWLAEYLTDNYGYDFAEGFFAANNETAPVCLQVNTLQTTAAQLAAEFENHGRAFSVHPWLPDCLLMPDSGAISALPGFNEGLFYVQDAAACAAVAALDLKAGARVLDCCAAPGGKSFAAAIAMQNRGEIISRDINEKKTRLINDGARRLGIDIIRAETRDAREPDGEKYDCVIADVPCSGMGVIRKKPEIRFKKREDLTRLPEIQSAILKAAAAAVKTGGELLYSTCTVLREENEGVVDAFLAENGDFEKVGFTLGNKKYDGCATLWPHIDGTDGFFICKLKRKI